MIAPPRRNHRNEISCAVSLLLTGAKILGGHLVWPNRQLDAHRCEFPEGRSLTTRSVLPSSAVEAQVRRKALHRGRPNSGLASDAVRLTPDHYIYNTT